MHPYINILGKQFPAFSVMVLIGIGLGSLIVYFNCKINRTNATDPMLTACIAFIGVIIGSGLLKPLMKLPDVIIRWDKYKDIPVGLFLSWFFGEMVFYGGLLGAFLAAYIFCRGFKIPFLKTADILAPAIPAGHAFGRLGCLFGGCCYGMEVDASNPFAIVYPPRTDGLDAVTAPSGVPLLAVPLLEFAGNLVIAAIVMLFSCISLKRGKRRAGQFIALYGILYGVQRFVLEFFRGDLIRGIYFGLSTSQIISIGVVAASAVMFVLPYIRKSEKAL